MQASPPSSPDMEPKWRGGWSSTCCAALWNMSEPQRRGMAVEVAQQPDHGQYGLVPSADELVRLFVEGCELTATKHCSISCRKIAVGEVK